MDNEVLIALIGGIVAVISTIVTGFVTIYKNQNKTHRAVNGRMDELIEVTDKLAKSQGIEIGQKRERSFQYRKTLGQRPIGSGDE